MRVFLLDGERLALGTEGIILGTEDIVLGTERLSLGNGWGGGPSTGVTNELLSLGGVITNVLLCGRRSTGSLLTCEFAHLLRLLTSDGGSFVELLINKLLVGLVDKRAEEEAGDTNKGKTPKWDNLDQEVGDEGSNESLTLLVCGNNFPS